MINILSSRKHSETETVPLVSGEWKHSHEHNEPTESTRFQENSIRVRGNKR